MNSLLPLHLILLLSIHIIFAFTRFLSLLTHFLPSFSFSPPSSLTEDLEQKRWSKIPKHVGIIFIDDGTNSGRKRIFKGIENILQWCEELGVESLNLFERNGLLTSSNSHENLLKSISVSSPNRLESLSSSTTGLQSFKLNSATIPLLPKVFNSPKLQQMDSAYGSISSHLPSTPPISTELQINILDAKAGRPHLAFLSQNLYTKIQSKEKTIDEVDSVLVGEMMEGFMEEMELLIVLGGPYLRLGGFPPWQLRLVEIYHHSSPNWLRSPKMKYEIFRNGLDIYGGAEMRLGR